MDWYRVEPVFPEDGPEPTRVPSPVVFPEALRAGYVAALAEHARPELAGYRLVPQTCVRLDMGGPISAKAKHYEFEVDGLTIVVPARDVAAYAGHTPRARRGGFYYGAWPVPVLVTEAQRDAIRAHLAGLLTEARAYEAAENAEHNDLSRHPNVRLRPRPVPKMGRA